MSRQKPTKSPLRDVFGGGEMDSLGRAPNAPQIDAQSVSEASASLAVRRASRYHSAPDDRDDCYPIAQSQSSNALARKLTTRMDPSQVDDAGEGRILDDGFKLMVSRYSELKNGISVSALKLLDILVIKATEARMNETLIRLPLRDFMKMRGLKDEKEARKQVKRDMDALDRVRFEYKGTGENRRSWFRVSLSGGFSGIVQGVIHYRFSEEFFESLRVQEAKYLYMNLPMKAFMLPDNHHPYAYCLARRLAEHKRMNHGKANEDIISVKTLLDACTNMPTYEDLGEAKQVQMRIRGPFERDLSALNDTIRWDYMHPAPDTFEKFLEAKIIVRWRELPAEKRVPPMSE